MNRDDSRLQEFKALLQEFRDTSEQIDNRANYPYSKPMYIGVTTAWLHMLYEHLEDDDFYADRALVSLRENIESIKNEEFIRQLGKNND